MSIDPELVLRHLVSAGDGGLPLPLWAVLDAARDERIYPFIRDHVEEHTCLYSGPPARAMQAVAPYLVRLRRDRPYTRELISRAWGNSWGIFFAGSGKLEQFRRHLRYFLRVQDEQGRKLLFRFYDPRVLRVYLPTCTARELWLFFGAISDFFTEGNEPGTLLHFRRVDYRLEPRITDLAAPVGAGTLLGRIAGPDMVGGGDRVLEEPA